MDLAAPGNEIKVAIRVRPLLPKELVAGVKSKWQCTEKTISQDNSQSSNTSYVFDRVFDENATNRMVYEELASDIVKQAMIGFNGTVFTYGQSGSGKTYTIDALRTFAIKSAYDYIENCPAREFLMRVSYIEIYNEKLTDLLSSDASTTLTVREDYERNVYIEGLQEIIVKSQDHVKDVLTQGNARRTFAETKLNERSSRAHCIFRLVIESREREDPEHSSVYVSYLNLVDLAGSERAGESTGICLREGISINLSLMTLSQVIRKLSGEQREFINYRDSKLTRILQNALEGNSKTAILCTVAPFAVEETHSTLRFALNAKKVKTKPQQNEVLTDSAMLKKSQLEITKLKNRIKELEERNLVQDGDELQSRREERERLIKEFSSFLCVSSKAREEKRGFDKKRRETVCVPQMYRSVDFKVPRMPVNVPKLEFPHTQLKQMDSFSIPESPPANDSAFAVSHSLDSPCTSQECTYCDLSFTSLEQAIVQESVLQKYQTKIKQYEADIADLNRKLKQRSGLFVTCRRDTKENKSVGSEFQYPTFCEEAEEITSDDDNVRGQNGGLDENIENVFEENETLKSQNVLYKNEIEGLKAQVEVLTVKFTQYDERREESEKNIAELSDRIKRDEEEITKFKAREEEIALHHEGEIKMWQEKVEKLEWERNMQEMKEEKGLLETSSIDKHDISGRDLHDDVEMQKKELLNEWEEVSRLKEELNKQAIYIENTLCAMEKEKERLQKERDRIDREWNDLEKANDDLRKEKEDLDKKQEDVASARLQEATKQTPGSDADRTERDHVVLENDSSVTGETEDMLRESSFSNLVDEKYNENIILKEEKESLLLQLDSLRQSVCELNARKCALESEMVNYVCEDKETYLPENTDMPGADKLQKEWEVLRNAQKQLQDREIELSEQEAVSERIQDKCCMLEELNERLEEEVQKLRMSQCNQEKVNDTEMAKQGNSLQEEWKKLAKYQAELAKQEENVERKIERLCMLEEEKEQFEEEKGIFYREKECLREAEMDLKKAKEAFKQEQLKAHQEVEQDGESDTVKRNQMLKEEEERLHEQWEHLRKIQEQFHQEKEAFRQTKSVDQARELLMKDQEALTREWCLLRQAQNDLKIEKEALEMSKGNVHKSDLSRREDTGRFKDNLSQLDDESGIVTATSWDNSSLCNEFKEGSENVSHCVQEKVQETLQEKKEELQGQWEDRRQVQEDMNVEILPGSATDVKCVEACEDSHSSERKFTKKGITDDTDHIEDVGKGELGLQNEEEKHLQCTVDRLQTLHDEVGKLQLEKEQLFSEKLISETEKEQLLSEKVIFEMEKEQLQEVIVALQRENKMLKEEKEDLQLGKKSHLDACSEKQNFSILQSENELETFVVDERNKELQNEWENLKENENTCEKERILLLSREESLKKENQRLQKQIENLKQCQHCLQQNRVSDSKQSLRDVRENMGEQDIEQMVKTEHRHVADIIVENTSLSVQNDPVGVLLSNQDLDWTTDLNEQNGLDETVRIPAGLSQSVCDVSRFTKVSSNGGDRAGVCDLLTELKTAGFFTNEKIDAFDEEKYTFDQEKDAFDEEKDIFDNEKDTFDEKKEAFDEERALRKETSKEKKDTFDEKKDMFDDVKDTFYVEKESFDEKEDKPDEKEETFDDNKDTSDQEKDAFDVEKETLDEKKDVFDEKKDVFDEEKDVFDEEKDVFDEEKENLQEEWGKLKAAQEQLSVKEAALRDLEKDIAKQSDIFNKFEAEQRKLQQSTDNLKQAEDILSRQQEVLKALEDNIKSELARLLTLQKEKERIQTEIEKLTEDKIVLEKEKGKLLEQQEIGLETNKDCHQDEETSERDIEMTEEEKNYLQTEVLIKETKTAIDDNPESYQMKNFIDQGKDSMFVAEQKNLQKEEEDLELKKAALQIEEERILKEKEMLQAVKSSLDEEAEKLKVDKEIINEKTAVFQQEHARLLGEQEILERKKIDLREERERLNKDLDEREAMHQREKEICQHEKETLEKQIAVFHEEQTIFQKEKESFKERCVAFEERQERLAKEKEIIEQNIVLIQEQEERLQTEKGMLEKTTAAFQKEQEEFQSKVQIFEKHNVALQEMQDRLKGEIEMFEHERITFQNEKERLQTEKELYEEKCILFEEEQRKLQTEKSTLEDAVAGLQEQQARCQEEMNIFQGDKGRLQEEKDRLWEEKYRLQEEKDGLQKEKDRLQEEKDRLQEEKFRIQDGKDRLQEERDRLQEEKDKLHETITELQQLQARYQKETEILQKEQDKLQEEKDRLQEEKGRLEEAEVNFQQKWDDFQTANTDIAKYREQLNEKERLIESRMKQLSSFEKDREKFQNEWGKLEKAQEDLKNERLSLNDRIMHHEEEKRKLQEEWSNVQQGHENLKQERILFQEKKNSLQEEVQSAWENLRQAQDKVAKKEEAVRQKYAEIEEKMQAVLEHERTLNDKDSQGTEPTATDPQLSAEGLMVELQKVEDDLEDAYEKIDRLENLITKGKAVLAEKTEAAREANDKVKELEEAIDALKSNVASLNLHLEAKSNECEKLKKMQDSYRTALREQEGLKKEMEAMVRGRTKDRECYEDTIRQLNLKLRDKQNAETSFVAQRDPPSECAPSLDQMRKIIEFENAAKFLELNKLKQGVQEQKAKITDLENEKSQLQAEIKKLQLLLDNESVKSEAMKSTANQAILARRKVEEELGQLRKQLGKGSKQSPEDTPDEVTKMLKNQLQEKDQLIDELSKSLDSRNMRWNAVVLRHRNLIEENHSLQKLVAEHQQKSADSVTSQVQCNVIKDEDRLQQEKQAQVADLLKENSELKASVEKLRLDFCQQTTTRETPVKQQQSQTRNVENLRELSTQTENNHLTQQPQAAPAFSAPTYRSGGAVESFVIAVKDREIRDFKKKLEKQSAKITDLEKEKSQLQTELQKLQLLFDSEAVKSETRKSTANQTVLAKQRDENDLAQQNKQPGKDAKQSTEEIPVEVTNMLRNQRQKQVQSFDQLMKSVHSRSVEWNTTAHRNQSLEEQNHSLQTPSVAEPQKESTGFSRWNAIKDNERKQKEKQAQMGNLSENYELKEAMKAVEQNTNPSCQKTHGSDVKQQPEDHRHRRFPVNNTGKENIPFGI